MLTLILGIGLILNGGIGNDQDAISEYVRSINTKSTTKKLNRTTPKPKETQTTKNKGWKIIDSKEREKTFELKEFVTFDPQADATWAGCVVNGKDLLLGKLNPILLERAPGKITITSASGTKKKSARLDRPSLSEYTDKLGILLREMESEPIANLNMSIEQVHSSKQAMLSFGLSADFGGGFLEASLNSENSSYSTRLLCRFIEKFYTVSFDAQRYDGIQGSENLFAKHVSVVDVKSAIKTDEPPAYLVNVTYGRMAFLMVDSTESFKKLKAAIEAGYNAVVTGTEAKLAAEHQDILKKSKTTFSVIGGKRNDALSDDPLSVFRKVVNSQSKLSDNVGVPISWSARYMNGNKDAIVSQTASWTETTTTNNPYMLKVHLESINVQHTCEGWPDREGDFVIDVEAPGSIIDPNNKTVNLFQWNRGGDDSLQHFKDGHHPVNSNICEISSNSQKLMVTFRFREYDGKVEEPYDPNRYSDGNAFKEIRRELDLSKALAFDLTRDKAGGDDGKKNVAKLKLTPIVPK